MNPTRTHVATALLAAFVAAVLVQDALRDDLSPVEHWVSHLSLGTHGWVNIAALILAGIGVLTLAPTLRANAPSPWPARWVTTAGVGLVIAGTFVADPPPGTIYTEGMTWHGQLHDVGGGLCFIGLFAACLTTRHLLSRRWGMGAAITVAGAWLLASGLAAFGYANEATTLPSGLAERVALFTGIAWLVVLGIHLERTPNTERSRDELRGISEDHPREDGPGSGGPHPPGQGARPDRARPQGR